MPLINEDSGVVLKGKSREPGMFFFLYNGSHIEKKNYNVQKTKKGIFYK